MDDPESSALAYGADPAVPSAPIEALAVVTVQDRPFGSISDCQVDGAGHPGDQGDHRGLVALPDDPQCPMTAVEPEVLGVGRACFTDPESVETEQGCQGGMVVVVTLSRE
jgi:hypothetical protein